MANGHGGARKGSGRKPKPLSQKIEEGNRGHRPLKKVEFAGEAPGPAADAPEYLRHMTNPIAGIPRPAEIYAGIVKYLEPSGCLPLIPEDLIADYAVAKHNLHLTNHQLAISCIVGVDDAENFEITPFTEAVLKMQKHVLSTWAPIWDIVNRNSQHKIENPETDMMMQIFQARLRTKKREEAAARG